MLTQCLLGEAFGLDETRQDRVNGDPAAAQRCLQRP